MRGAQPLILRIGYVYPGGYTQADAFATYGDDPSVTVQTGRNATTFWTRRELLLGSLDVADAGLGGWSLDIHHRFDVNRAQLYRGDGSRVRRHREAYAIRTVVGDFEEGEPQPASGLAEDVRLGAPCGLALDAVGNLYIAEPEYHVVRRVTPQGELSIFAGTFGVSGDKGDGLAATSAQLNGPCDLAFGPDGSLYIADEGNQRLRHVAADGQIDTVMGGFRTTEGDGIPAAQATLPSAFGLEVDNQGVVYLAEPNNHRVRRIRPDGVVETIVGTGEPGDSGDGGPGLEATLDRPVDLAVAPDGALLIADSGNHRVRRLDPSGVLEAYLGSGDLYPAEEGGPALDVSIGETISLAVDAQGRVFVATEPDAVVLWRLDADRTLVRVAGTNEVSWTKFTDDELAGADTSIFGSPKLLIDGYGDLLYSENDFDRVRKLIGPFRHYDTEGFWFPSERSPVLYHFDAAGRHLETVHAKTGASLFRFEYDDDGLLSAVEDGDGLRTEIERDAAGLPTAIIAPFGQRTGLSVDGNGWLELVTNPAGENVQLEHSASGLLERWWDQADPATLHEAHYDELGRLERETGPDDASLDLVRFGTNGEITVEATTAEGRMSSYTLLPKENGDQWRTVVAPDGLVIEERRGLLKRDIDQPDGTEVRIREASDPRFGLSAPGLASFELTTPSGLTGTLSRSFSLGLDDPSDPLSLSWEQGRITWNGNTFERTLDLASLTETLTTPEGRSQTRMSPIQ